MIEVNTPEESERHISQPKKDSYIEQTIRQTFETLEGRIDQFLENPPMQPKREIGEYIGAGENILKGHDEAIGHVQSGGEIIVRSEHPQEYDGASGLLDSFSITLESELFKIMEKMNQEDFKEYLKKKSEKNVEYYCKLLDLNFEDFYKNISYSYWKKVEGVNRSIVADSAIPNRYHIFTSDINELSFPKYLVIENGEIITDYDKTNKKITEIAQNSVSFYEEKRRLQKFNPNHCPIIEFQTDKAYKNHPLQYHRTRDMEDATFTLDRDLEESEIEATFIRGATSPEGEVFRILINYQVGAQYYHKHFSTELLNYQIDCLIKESYGIKPNRQSPQEILDEVSALSIKPNHIPHWGQNGTIIDAGLRDPIFEDIMTKKNEIVILLNDRKSIFYNIGNFHISKSAIINPRLTLGIPYDFIKEKMDDFTRGIKIKVVSDGKKAYLKLEP